MKIKLPALSGLLSLVFLILTIVACGPAAVNTPLPSPTDLPPTVTPSPVVLSPQQIVQSSLGKMKSLSGLHYSLVLTFTASSSSGSSSNSTPISVEIDTAPKTGAEHVIASNSGSANGTEYIYVSGACYEKSGPGWTTGSLSTCQHDPLSWKILSVITNTSLLGESTINGRNVYHLRGDFDKNATDAITIQNFAASTTGAIDLLIGKDDLFMYQSTFKTDMGTSGSGDVNVSINFSKFNTPVIIQAPADVGTPVPTSTAVATPIIVPPQSTPSSLQFPAAPTMMIDPSKHYTATIYMKDFGPLVIELYPQDAPITVNNFVFLSRQLYYDNVTCHRIIKDFVVQCGDPTGTGTGGPGYKFPDEPVKRPYEDGTIAMANSGPNTNGSQFFIVYGAQGRGLPPNYTIFGKVVSGLDLVAKIENVQTDQGDRPLTPVVMEKITIDESK